MVLRVRARHAAGCVLMGLCLGSLPFSWSTHAAQQSAPTSPVAPQKALLDRYCLTCHTQRLKERGTVPIALDSLDLESGGCERGDLGEGRREDARRADAAGGRAATRQGRRTTRLPRGSKPSSIAAAPRIPIRAAPSPSIV